MQHSVFQALGAVTQSAAAPSALPAHLAKPEGLAAAPPAPLGPASAADNAVTLGAAAAAAAASVLGSSESHAPLTERGGASVAHAAPEPHEPSDAVADRSLPPPRSTAPGGSAAAAASSGAGARHTAALSFTPRVLPTPLRESKVAEEEEWHARNQLAAQQAASRRAQPQGNAAQAAQSYYRGVALCEAGDHRSAAAAFESSGSHAGSDSHRRALAAAKLAACAYVEAGATGGGDAALQRACGAWEEAGRSRQQDGTAAGEGSDSSSRARAGAEEARLCAVRAAAAVRRLPAAAGDCGDVAARLARIDPDAAGPSAPVLAALVDIACGGREEARLTAAAKACALLGPHAQLAAMRALDGAAAAAPSKLSALHNAAAARLNAADWRGCQAVCTQAVPPLREGGGLAGALPATPRHHQPQQQPTATAGPPTSQQDRLGSVHLLMAACALEAGDAAQALAATEAAAACRPWDADVAEDLRVLREQQQQRAAAAKRTPSA